MVQVEDDKAQITAVIQQLDEKKRIALEETWKQVRYVHRCTKKRTTHYFANSRRRSMMSVQQQVRRQTWT